jgi:hypothetical protein
LNTGQEKKRDLEGGARPEGVEDVAAGREAVDVLVGERAEVLVADGADRPCGGGGHGGAGIRGCAALVFWRWKRVVFPSFISRDGDFVAGRFFRNAQEISWRDGFFLQLSIISVFSDFSFRFTADCISIFQ